MIDKVVKRSLLKNKKLFLSVNFLYICVMILFTICIYSRFYGLANYDEYATKTKLEDFEVQTYEPLTNYQIQDMEEKNNIELDKTQYYKYKYDDTQITIHPKYSEDDITHPVLVEGKNIEKDNEIVINQEYAQANDLKLGDEYKLSDQTFTIVGLASFPGTMYPVQDGSLFPTNKTVGEVSITNNMFSKIKSPQIIYLGKFNEDISKKQQEVVYDNLEAYSEVSIFKTNILNIPMGGTKEVPNVYNVAKRSSKLNLSIVHIEYFYITIMIGAMAILIAIITLVLCSIILKSILNRQRREMGILKALGIYNSQIISSFQKYFSYGLIISMIIGIISGIVMSYFLEQLYGQFFNIVHYPIDPLFFIVLIIGAIVIYIVITLILNLIINKNINQNILLLVSNVEKDIKPKKTPKIKMKFKNKMKINTLLVNRGKTIILVYGVFFSMFLFVFGFSLGDSIVNLKSNIKGDYFTYDYIVNYSPGFTPAYTSEEQNTLITFYANIKEIENKDINSSDIITVIGYDQDNDYIDFKQELEENEVIITKSIKDKYKVNIGDEVEINNPQNKDETYTLEIKDVIDIQYEDTVYINKEYITNTFTLSEDYYNSLVGEGKTKEEVMQGDKDGTFYSYDDLIDSFNDYSVLMTVALSYIAAIAGIISLITIITISSLIVSTNKKQISIMKIFGYTPKEINTLILSPYRYIVIIISVIAYPISVIAAQFYLSTVMSFIPDMTYPIVIKMNWMGFVVSILFIYIIYYVNSKLMIRKINQINLGEVLKADD